MRNKQRDFQFQALKPMAIWMRNHFEELRKADRLTPEAIKAIWSGKQGRYSYAGAWGFTKKRNDRWLSGKQNLHSAAVVNGDRTQGRIV